MEYNSRWNYNELFPHKIPLDTDNRKNTVIRKNDLAIVTETKPRESEPEPKPRLIHMVACKTVGEYKRKKEKIKNFCLEEKAAKAKQQEGRAKQARAVPLQTNSIPQTQNVIDTEPLGHAEVVAMTRRNQQAQKRPRNTKKQPARQHQKQKQQQQPKHKSPGIPKRPQWLKDAKARSPSRRARRNSRQSRKQLRCNNPGNLKHAQTESYFTPVPQTIRVLHR